MTASDHAQTRPQRFPLRERGASTDGEPTFASAKVSGDVALNPAIHGFRWSHGIRSFADTWRSTPTHRLILLVLVRTVPAESGPNPLVLPPRTGGRLKKAA